MRLCSIDRSFSTIIDFTKIHYQRQIGPLAVCVNDDATRCVTLSQEDYPIIAVWDLTQRSPCPIRTIEMPVGSTRDFAMSLSRRGRYLGLLQNGNVVVKDLLIGPKHSLLQFPTKKYPGQSSVSSLSILDSDNETTTVTVRKSLTGKYYIDKVNWNRRNPTSAMPSSSLPRVGPWQQPLPEGVRSPTAMLPHPSNSSALLQKEEEDIILQSSFFGREKDFVPISVLTNPPGASSTTAYSSASHSGQHHQHDEQEEIDVEMAIMNTYEEEEEEGEVVRTRRVLKHPR